ncbi:MAG: folylpolyglutamate synthase/dihydrofolate synthase family protein, partial [Acidobacteriota bacterium]
MHFDEALRYLLSLGHETLTIKLGLKNIKLLLAALANPQESYPAIQIAGTNGKGSTAVVLDSICQSARFKTGLFTSPHLLSITERVRIGGQVITPEAFARHATEVRAAAQRLLDAGQITALPSFFEQVTAIALVAFRAAKVELAILETGLGGRLDATSAAGATLIAITPIGFDHEEYLGSTLESIAAEKAAIIRPGSTAVIAAQLPQALAIIQEHCERVRVQPSVDECSAQVESATADGRLSVTFETRKNRYEEIVLPLRGRHQVNNVALAIRLAESLRDRGFTLPYAAIIAGIESANHPGRLELWDGKPNFLFDGAHNPAGAQAIRDYLDEFVKRPVTLVFGAMRDKNLEQMASLLFPRAGRLVLTTMENPRAATVAAL